MKHRLSHYLTAAARYVDSPRLLAMRSRNILLDTYQHLNQPWFRNLEIRTVLDIGANTGYFARTMMALLPHAAIYAFEPLPDCYETMHQQLSNATNFAAFNIGLGDQPGELQFERNSWAPSSSFLTMTEKHYEAFPYTHDHETVTVRVDRLDDVADTLAMSEPLLIKIDVQGYEGKVLRGGEATVKRAKLLIVETSFVELYAGQPLFDDVHRLLNDWGFQYRGALDQLEHPETGAVLQQDSVFIRD